MCHFAHSNAELRQPGHGGPGPSGGPTFMIQGSDGKIKYKTSMCTVFMEQGFCPRGENCAFAHSAKQLMEAQARDPKYKTMLCEAWKSKGYEIKALFRKLQEIIKMLECEIEQ